ncbi:MAG: hypothetical protein WC222_10860 [Parachlamydiales bacterium]|jgi:hypothetical protein
MTDINRSILNNIQINVLAADLNRLLESNGPQNEINSIVEKLSQIIISNTASIDEKNAVIKLIDKRFSHIRLELKEKIIPSSKDIVCENSQGKIDAVYGKNACAVICQKALIHYFSGRPISSEEDMNNIMRNGIEDYKSRGFEGTIFFDDVISNNGQDNSSLIALQPDNYDGFEDWYIDMMKQDPLHNQLPGVVKEGFHKQLTTLDKVATTQNQKAAGVITCNAETIAVFFLKRESPYYLTHMAENIMERIKALPSAVSNLSKPWIAILKRFSKNRTRILIW